MTHASLKSPYAKRWVPEARSPPQSEELEFEGEFEAMDLHRTCIANAQRVRSYGKLVLLSRQKNGGNITPILLPSCCQLYRKLNWDRIERVVMRNATSIVSLLFTTDAVVI
jgi:hypothetical protein